MSAPAAVDNVRGDWIGASQTKFRRAGPRDVGSGVGGEKGDSNRVINEDE